MGEKFVAEQFNLPFGARYPDSPGFKNKDLTRCWGKCQFKLSSQDPKIIMVVPEEEQHGIQGIGDG